MPYLYSIAGIVLFGVGLYVCNTQDEKARRKGKWASSRWGTKYTLWIFPMYICFVGLAICLLPLLELLD